MASAAPTRFTLVPKVFFDTLAAGLDLFVDALGFEVKYSDDDFAVVERGGAKAYIVASPEFAAGDRPELTIETDAIDQRQRGADPIDPPRVAGLLQACPIVVRGAP